jgi:hypothetical protein
MLLAGLTPLSEKNPVEAAVVAGRTGGPENLTSARWDESFCRHAQRRKTRPQDFMNLLLGE